MKRIVSIALLALALSFSIASADDEEDWNIIGGTNDGGCGVQCEPAPPPPQQ